MPHPNLDVSMSRSGQRTPRGFRSTPPAEPRAEKRQLDETARRVKYVSPAKLKVGELTMVGPEALGLIRNQDQSVPGQVEFQAAHEDGTSEAIQLDFVLLPNAKPVASSQFQLPTTVGVMRVDADPMFIVVLPSDFRWDMVQEAHPGNRGVPVFLQQQPDPVPQQQVSEPSL